MHDDACPHDYGSSWFYHVLPTMFVDVFGCFWFEVQQWHLLAEVLLILFLDYCKFQLPWWCMLGNARARKHEKTTLAMKFVLVFPLHIFTLLRWGEILMPCEERPKASRWTCEALVQARTLQYFKILSNGLAAWVLEVYLVLFGFIWYYYVLFASRYHDDAWRLVGYLR